MKKPRQSRRLAGTGSNPGYQNWDFNTRLVHAHLSVKLMTDEGMNWFLDKLVGTGQWKYDPDDDVWITPDRDHNGKDPRLYRDGTRRQVVDCRIAMAHRALRGAAAGPGQDMIRELLHAYGSGRRREFAHDRLSTLGSSGQGRCLRQTAYQLLGVAARRRFCR